MLRQLAGPLPYITKKGESLTFLLHAQTKPQCHTHTPSLVGVCGLPAVLPFSNLRESLKLQNSQKKAEPPPL